MSLNKNYAITHDLIRLPVNVPAIAPVPVIVGEVNDLFVSVWVAPS